MKLASSNSSATIRQLSPMGKPIAFRLSEVREPQRELCSAGFRSGAAVSVWFLESGVLRVGDSGYRTRGYCGQGEAAASGDEAVELSCRHGGAGAGRVGRGCRTLQSSVRRSDGHGGYGYTINCSKVARSGSILGLAAGCARRQYLGTHRQSRRVVQRSEKVRQLWLL